LEALRSSTPYGAYNFDQGFLDLEVAYCRYRGGDLQQSNIVEKLDQETFAHLDVDERLVAAWMVCELLALAPTTERYRSARQHFSEVAGHFRSTEQTIRSQLKSFHAR